MGRLLRRFVSISALALLAGTAGAADPKSTSDPSPEQRQKMAAVHQKMADCLKSNRPMNECREEMRKGCHDTMGEQGCPMMESMGGGMGPGMMGGPTHGKPAMGGAEHPAH